MRVKKPSCATANVPKSESPTDGSGAVKTGHPSTAQPQAEDLEQAFAAIDEQTDDLMKATKQVGMLLKKIKGAAKENDFSQLRTFLVEGKSALLSLGCDFVKTQSLLKCHEARPLADDAFYQELLTATQHIDGNLYAEDDEAFSYSILLELLKKKGPWPTNDSRENRLNPLAPVKRLNEGPNKPLRFTTNAFLEILYTAYSIVVAGRGKSLIGKGPVIPLVDLYHLLTLLPLQASEYPRQKFGHDVYLLDESGKVTTESLYRANFHASTGIRNISKTLTVIAQGGRKKPYYGISFVKIG